MKKKQIDVENTMSNNHKTKTIFQKDLSMIAQIWIDQI